MTRRPVPPPWSKGSRWFRLDPHIHAPGTLRNDNFKGDWEGYLAAIENATPRAEMIGVTDYFTFRTFKEARRRQVEERRLKDIVLFPNVELRLTERTHGRGNVNVHLLVNPDAPNLERMLTQLLSTLTYFALHNTWNCTEESLILFGQARQPNDNLAPEAALRSGASQFTVNRDQLRGLLREGWATEHIILAVVGGAHGIGGCSEQELSTLKSELGRMAQVIFSSNAKDREFHGTTHRTPCWHGSDAHEVSRVLKPDEDRMCWIRAAPTWSGLRQTLAEPMRRVRLGEEPSPPTPSRVIRSVTVENAEWLKPTTFELNDGLVTIIGARGSGKTALADLIAAGAGSLPQDLDRASFAYKAGKHLDGVTVRLTWQNDDTTHYTFGAGREADPQGRVQYLSQQFVEKLCNDTGGSSLLLREVERVVFEAIPDEARLEATDFGQLRKLMLSGVVAERVTLQGQIAELSQLVGELKDQTLSLPSLKKSQTEISDSISRLRKDLEVTTAKKGDPELHNALTALRDRIQRTLKASQAATLRAHHLKEVEREIQALHGSIAAKMNNLRAAYGKILGDNEWANIAPQPNPNFAATVAAAIQKERELAAAYLERSVGPEAAARLVDLQAEEKALVVKIGLDQVTLERIVQLTRAIQAEEKRLEELTLKVTAIEEEAPKRRAEAHRQRGEAILKVFETIAQEEELLRQLYEPLRGHLATVDPSVKRLDFKVARVVDVDGWVKRGEALMDLRADGPFRPQGTLREVVRLDGLEKAWCEGSPAEIASAFEAFCRKHLPNDIDIKFVTGADRPQFSRWLHDTNHIKVGYSILFGESPLDVLSPGTRGIALLTLYLGLDMSDTRPLLIDQPEENLDPASVYSTLVDFFLRAAARRQILMVTHNANLVVNADADQVIVASDVRRPIGLPTISYESGGFEDAHICKKVCELLEGGKEAFDRRRRRYPRV